MSLCLFLDFLVVMVGCLARVVFVGLGYDFLGFEMVLCHQICVGLRILQGELVTGVFARMAIVDLMVFGVTDIGSFPFAFVVVLEFCISS